MLERPVIMDPSNWADVLSTIWSGLQYLDSIVLFDTDGCHLTFLGFDIALMCFGIVWNTVGLWNYDFDSAWSESSSAEISDSDFFAQFSPAPVDGHDESKSSESETDILADDDEDFE